MWIKSVYVQFFERWAAATPTNPSTWTNPLRLKCSNKLASCAPITTNLYWISSSSSCSSFSFSLIHFVCERASVRAQDCVYVCVCVSRIVIVVATSFAFAFKREKVFFNACTRPHRYSRVCLTAFVCVRIQTMWKESRGFPLGYLSMLARARANVKSIAHLIHTHTHTTFMQLRQRNMCRAYAFNTNETAQYVLR